MIQTLFRTLLVIGAVAATTTFMPNNAGATRERARQRAAQKAGVVELMGYSCRDEIEMNEIDQGESFFINTEVYRNVSYAFIGAGDDGISDLDLELYDSNWSLVARDNDADPTPVIEVVANRTTVAHLKVIAYAGGGWATAVICYRRR